MQFARIGASQKGFSLVEIMLVIAIIIALAITAFVLYGRMDASVKAGRERDNIMAIQAGVKSIFNTREYSGIRNSNLNQARIFPATMNAGDYSPTAPIKSAWNQDVEVWGAYLVDGSADTVFPADHFHIFYRSMPNDVCERLVPAVFKYFAKVYVGGAEITNIGEAVAMCSPVGEPTVHVFFVMK